MAIVPTTDNVYTGNGTTTQFAIGFDYLNAGDVAVSVDEVLVSFTFATSGIVSVTPAPANGARVRVFRNTDATVVPYVFTDGVPFLTRYSDFNWKALLYAFQEAWAEFKNNATNYLRTLRATTPINPIPDNRANKLLGFGADGQPLAVEPSASSVPALDIRLSNVEATYLDAADIADRLQVIPNVAALASTPVVVGRTYYLKEYHAGTGFGGGDLVGVAGSTTYDNAITFAGSGGYFRRLNMEEIDVTQAGAEPITLLYTPDSTSAFNTCIATGLPVRFLGTYIIDPSVSIILQSNTVLRGYGTEKSALLAKYNTSGSVIKRSFNPLSSNSYVTNVKCNDFAVYLNHIHQSSIPANIQIGFDFRNITRTDSSNTYVGNYRFGVSAALYPNAGVKSQAVRGYGYVYGNVSGSDPAYAGGEVHTNRDSKSWWIKKAVVIDDSTLSPASAAYKTIIANMDIQTCGMAISQESQYGTGSSFIDNLIQDMMAGAGDSDPVYCYRLAGYENRIEGGYIETRDSSMDFLIKLDSTADNNVVRPFYHDNTESKILSDLGTKNSVAYFAGSVGNKNLRDYYNKKPLSISAQFYWNGSAFIVVSDYLTASNFARTGVGDYTITLPATMPTYSVSISLDTNASGHMGGWSMLSRSSSNMRIVFYAQNGATSTQVDPRSIDICITQIKT